ncbi:hypothetical protein CK501_13465 [Halovibrio salipaludis]|uniref:Uncharacterized protein n=1 Tax=Halovibrio salipaludis TaxID=2032626 RepID=A0A2A2F1P9_9GAMM|nr:hypothetical protein [Halovibrio salipaludis]PAU78690.1 hypothetical protein CK501_13465 [Halovibrio salipaludis]
MSWIRALIGTSCLAIGSVETTWATLAPPADPEPPPRVDIEELPEDFFDWDGPRYLDPQDTWLDQTGHWVVRRRRIHSRQVEALGLGIDQTLSGQTWVDQDNDSYLRLGAFNRYTEDGRMGFEPEARFKLDVPTSEEKFRIIVESDANDLAPLSEQQQRGTLTPEEADENSFTAGALRFLSPLSERWNASTDVGARLHMPLEFFARARTWSDWQLSREWRLRVDQRVFWYLQEGWISRSWFGFHRPLGPHWRFRASSEVRWVHRKRGFEMAQIFRLQRRYRNRHFVRLRFGVLGDTFNNWARTEYFTDMLYRKRLHDDWLYGEIIPSLRYRREEDFQPEASLTFRIEMFFSSSGDLQ